VTDKTSDELPHFSPTRTCPFHPSQYAELRSERPVSQVTLRNGNPAWLIANYEYARQFLADPRLTANRAHPSYPDTHARPPAPDQQAKVRPPVTSQQAKGLLTWMDPPEHTSHRRRLVNEFSARRVQRLRPRIQEIVDACIDRMLAGDRPVDLVQALSLPVPSQVICELLGVPPGDRDLFDHHTSVLINRNSTPEQRFSALNGLRGYLGDLIEEKTRTPQDDLLSRLVRKYEDAGDLDHELLIGLAMVMRTAGHESTANMISLGAVTLMENPDQLAELQADPALIPSAVEELLRYLSIGDVVTSRVATADIEIGGVVIRKDEGVIALSAAANHDDQAFDEPSVFDIHRDARRHVAFGYGIHQCLGQNLARLELEVVFASLFTRIPDLRLAVPAGELSSSEDGAFHGVDEVPVTW
jgi:cytochrome P450